MAYLTQYSGSVPVIKFHIDQILMTIGQNIEMDICVPEDGVADNHATVEAIQQAESYRFVVKSHKNESSLDLNGEIISQGDLNDGDWLIIGGVEFQFTDDGINQIKESISAIPAAMPLSEPKQQNNVSEALQLIKDLKKDLQEEVKTMSTKEFIANSRQSRRRLAF